MATAMTNERRRRCIELRRVRACILTLSLVVWAVFNGEGEGGRSTRLMRRKRSGLLGLSSMHTPSFRRIQTEDDIGLLRIADRESIPIQFGKKHYKNVLNVSRCNRYSRIAMLNGTVAGGFCCVKNQHLRGTSNCAAHELRPGSWLYIMSLGVRPRFQGLSLGKAMWQQILQMGLDDPNITDITVHLPVGDQAQFYFYKAMGFKVLSVEANYYQNYTESLGIKDGFQLVYRIRTSAMGNADQHETWLLQQAERDGRLHELLGYDPNEKKNRTAEDDAGDNADNIDDNEADFDENHPERSILGQALLDPESANNSQFLEFKRKFMKGAEFDGNGFPVHLNNGRVSMKADASECSSCEDIRDPGSDTQELDMDAAERAADAAEEAEGREEARIQEINSSDFDSEREGCLDNEGDESSCSSW
mmetsp:Transcript_6907/g.12690  ORF Transcript_6907/g.12690 Transcript_6907/m.12690 type:complete len:419 (-) Transcript_6907:190-1446(-)|eukprot:CAMPEP_0197520058 /NCGR_PEP_ID=MMETSP1318-20131121/5364_1 /TAXON_ID=552666 /ORGANISM="Partenskyella glossopodia, Strain RCC365" /LENGTH=418 /DNA_ID=CAMNT_0043071413 /DNA_START=202 /DNA_END=1458 /DNA_ORIENTATION=-